MYTIPTFDEIRRRYLRDVQNLLPDAATDADSDYAIRAAAVASAVEGLYHHQLWIARQVLPNTADPEMLVRHAALRGIVRKPALSARGEATVTGVAGSVIPAGEMLRHVETGLSFVTLDRAVVSQSGSVVVGVGAARAGAVARLTNAPVMFLQAPAGVLSQAELTIYGGMDAETDAQLLARLLDYLRNPPGGGNVYDYRRWAVSVPGVSAAWVFPLRRGLGTVDVAVLSAGGLPSAELVASVQAVIDVNRPVACPDARAVSPTPLLVPVTAKLRVSGTTLVLIRPAVEAALAAYFDTLPPGGVVLKSQIEAAVSGVTGVTDRLVTAPAANVQALVDEGHLQWPRLGALTLEAL